MAEKTKDQKLKERVAQLKLRKFDISFIEIAKRLKEQGFTNKDVGFFLGVTGTETIKNWSDKVPEFGEAIATGRNASKIKLIAKGIEAACGYVYEDVNEKWEATNQLDEDGNPKMVLKGKSVFRKHQPANPKILMAFLAILDPEFRNIWSQSDKVNKNITLKIDGSADSEQLKDLFGKLLAEDTERPGRKSVVSIEVDGRNEKKSGVPEAVPGSVSPISADSI